MTTQSRSRILVVEDDYQVAEILTRHLTEAGFDVSHAADGNKGMTSALNENYDLVILDLVLPGKEGTEICRAIRSRGQRTKIMMLSSLREEHDKVAGLEIGADDYVTKPFSLREIVARTKAILRRDDCSQSPLPAGSVSLGPIVMDLDARSATVDGKAIELTATEFDLLAYLVRSPGRVFSRQDLLTSVWGYTSGAYEQTVNTHINRLRNKVERDPAKPLIIETIWGVGYRCVAP